VAEVLRVRLLVGVDEGQVERALEGGEGVERGPDPHVDQSVEPCAGDVGAGHLGVLGVDLAGHELPVCRQGAGEPDRRVAAQRADLEDPPGADRTGEQVQQLALGRRDVDRGQPGERVGLERGVEHRILGE
jgi:hypothetical protein